MKFDETITPSIAAKLLEGPPEGEARAEKELIAKICASIAFMGGFSVRSAIILLIEPFFHSWSRLGEII